MKSAHVTLLLGSIALFACSTTGHKTVQNILEGNKAATSGDFQTATSKFETAITLTPESQTAKRNLAIVLVKTGNYSRARRYFEMVATQYQSDAEFLYFYGESLRGEEEFSAALRLYQKALRLTPGDLRVQKAIAWTWYKSGLYERTIAVTEPQLVKTPNDLQIRLILGSALNKKGKFTQAIGVLGYVEQPGFNAHSNDKVTANTEISLMKSALADAYYGVENYNKALVIYQQVLRDRPFLAQALTGAAKCHLKFQDNAKAIAKLERATKADPNFAEAHFVLGKVHEARNKTASDFYLKRFLLLAKNRRDLSQDIKVARQSLQNTP